MQQSHIVSVAEINSLKVPMSPRPFRSQIMSLKTTVVGNLAATTKSVMEYNISKCFQSLRKKINVFNRMYQILKIDF